MFWDWLYKDLNEHSYLNAKKRWFRFSERILRGIQIQWTRFITCWTRTSLVQVQVQDMELLGWLNAGSLIMQNADDEEEEEEEEPMPAAAANFASPSPKSANNFAKKVKNKVQDMELLGWLNTPFFLVTQPAAAVSSLDRRRQGGGRRVQVQASHSQVQVRHHFITQPDSHDPSFPLDSNDPSRPHSIRMILPAPSIPTIPSAEHEYSFGHYFVMLFNWEIYFFNQYFQPVKKFQRAGSPAGIIILLTLSTL